MTSNSIVLTGRVVSEVRAEQHQNDGHLTKFRLAVPTRRFDAEVGRMTTVGMSHYTVVCWRRLARNVVGAVRKGDSVIVAGRLRVRDWTSESGQSGTVAEVSATAVGHDLGAHASDAA